MSSYILVLILFPAKFSNASSVAMQEFSSLRSCNEAVKMIKKATSERFDYICVEK